MTDSPILMILERPFPEAMVLSPRPATVGEILAALREMGVGTCEGGHGHPEPGTGMYVHCDGGF